MNATDLSQDDTLDKEYTGINQSTSINDNLLLMLAILIEGGTGAIVLDDRTNSETIPLNVVAYDRNITVWNTKLYGLGTLTESLPMTPDLSITETNRATVDAYTELETSAKLYDYAKSYLVTNYLGESSTIVSRNGDLINAGSYDIVLDGDFPSAFDITGNKITIKANEFVGGLVTTGVITLLNLATVDGSYTDVNGTINAVGLDITVKDSSSNPIENARCLLVGQTADAITITRSGSNAIVTSTSHGLNIGDEVVIKGASEKEYNGINIITNIVDVNTYEYSVSGTPVSPATGTITSQIVYVNELTDVSGMVSDSTNYVSDIPVTLVIRKSSTSTFFKPSSQNATITSSGFNVETVMIKDQ
jgi:hypothetical protein